MANVLEETLDRMVASIYGDASPMKKFLGAQGLYGVSDVALTCTAETNVDETLGKVAQAGGVPYESLADKVKVKRLWAACRQSYDSGRGRNAGGASGGPGGPGPFDEFTPLPTEVEKSSREGWAKKHNFVLSLSRLLVDYQMNGLWKGIHASPRYYPVIPLERIRLAAASLDKPADTGGVIVRAGAPATAESVDVDVTGTHQAWLRVRAYFHTMAYLSLDVPDFFDFQAADAISEKILAWIHKKHKGAPSDQFLPRRLGVHAKPLPGGSLERPPSEDRRFHRERVPALLDRLGEQRGGGAPAEEAAHAIPAFRKRRQLHPGRGQEVAGLGLQDAVGEGQADRGAPAPPARGRRPRQRKRRQGPGPRQG